MKTPILKGWWKHPRLWLHLFIFNRLEDDVKQLIIADLDEMNRRYSPDNYRSLIYYLIFQKPYRNLFYYRRGPVSRYLSTILKPYPLFYINDDNAVGGGAYVLNHPYSTIINAKEIGSNFTCCQLTTIGNAKHGRNDLKPSIGNNVSLGPMLL